MSVGSTNNKSQSTKIKVNKEYENLVHPLSKENHSKLRASIKALGQHYPIIINQSGIILDGHHRYKVCQELQLDPKFEVKTFSDQYHEKLFVIDSNLERRQLNDFQRIELQLVRESILKKIAKENQGAGISIQKLDLDKIWFRTGESVCKFTHHVEDHYTHCYRNLRLFHCHKRNECTAFVACKTKAGISETKPLEMINS